MKPCTYALRYREGIFNLPGQGLVGKGYLWMYGGRVWGWRRADPLHPGGTWRVSPWRTRRRCCDVALELMGELGVDEIGYHTPELLDLIHDRTQWSPLDTAFYRRKRVLDALQKSPGVLRLIHQEHGGRRVRVFVMVM